MMTLNKGLKIVWIALLVFWLLMLDYRIRSHSDILGRMLEVQRQQLEREAARLGIQ